MSREFIARYSGVCPDCDGPIRPGQLITRAPLDDGMRSGTTIHVTCPEPMEGAVCPSCFTRRALSGECGCDS